MKTSSERFYGLDHLRALAITLVLFYHSRSFDHPAWVDEYGRFGWTGVDLFFVLSGFLISNQLFKEIKNHGDINLRSFFIKRFFRIIPPYLFTVLLYFCIPFFRERESLAPLWKFLTFTQNYGLDVISKGTFSHAWSLCIEEQFYLILPFSLLLFLKTGTFRYLKYMILFTLIFCIMIRWFSWELFVVPNLNTDNFWKEWYMKIYYPTYTRLDSLAIGVLIGYLFRFSASFKTFINKHGNLFLVIGVLLLGFSFWFCNEQTEKNASIFGFLAVAISYGLIVVAAISQSSLLSKSGSFVTSQLAGLSYAIYLSHKGIIHMVQIGLKSLDIQMPENIILFVCLFSCIGGALIYRYAIENPALKLRKRFLKRS
ncbi:acyltransferase [Chryseobacterium sp. T16E-39]|uniref:acyltransferase family protein n=1 Tax=Chryseobacterium sp. T16E-39 TaxID=2015076 RepID=UPI000B5B2905|nr:acyltransferase [Chryseobacterium sp. T16E-39]ASK31183.1 acyltransferase [Chryseobacterium sp. T16E-39]